MKIAALHILQHVPFEGPGHILNWAAGHGLATRVWSLHAGETPPSPRDDEALCILGGPMNIYEDREHPWLRWERNFLAEQARRSTPMLGVCLGAQLLAHAHGAKVFGNETKEIGWMPLRFDDEARSLPGTPASLTVLHWHGDTFELPSGARRLARTDHCLNQAFVCGRSLAFQFHLEAGAAECERMIANCGGELVDGVATIQNAETIREGASKYSKTTAEILEAFLDWHFFRTVKTRRAEI